MSVIILHPAEELKLISFQKELISELYSEGRIIYRNYPLWIHIPDSIDGKMIKAVTLGEIETATDKVFIPVEIETTEGSYTSKLTLVCLHSGRQFSGFDRQLLQQKKQPVRQLKVFRLGIDKKLSLVSKCIIKSKWMKIR